MNESGGWDLLGWGAGGLQWGKWGKASPHHADGLLVDDKLSSDAEDAVTEAAAVNVPQRGIAVPPIEGQPATSPMPARCQGRARPVVNQGAIVNCKRGDFHQNARQASTHQKFADWRICCIAAEVGLDLLLSLYSPRSPGTPPQSLKRWLYRGQVEITCATRQV